MAFKFVIFIAFIAANASAAIIPAAPLAVAPAPVLARTVEIEEYDPHPQYQYGYDVQDTLSGDSKGHVEERDGDVVRGEYSLVDPDGFKRTVTYTADSVNGFNAVVRRDPLVVAAAPIVNSAPIVAAAPAPIVRAARVVAAAPAPIVRAAPIVAAAPAPFIRAAPLAVAPLRYTAPLTYAAAPAVAVRRF